MKLGKGADVVHEGAIQRSRMAWAAGLILALAAGAVVTLLARPASAIACPGPGAPLNTVYKAAANGRGARVTNPGMLVEDGNVDCGRVSSLLVCNATCGNFGDS
jgi:hypothetical protein